MKNDKSYYYDEENDLFKYIEGDEGNFSHWVNPYLTLMFPHGCKDLTPKNIIGFEINEMRHMLHKAEEQASIPLTPEQEGHMKKVFKKLGWEYSVDVDGNRI